ncbi:hypothetical protein [Clostridium pasteurianum]|uniref:Uncharacterized protein n=1 Tax=Clostridium pasteurianum BC1 TaxID=86416 RepID=R4K166_CLOPA|nr:hypothetical protein [Clostridium pasteurianum]AGK96313.1 hypothetical protein Clopa_1328 [Clostridium pasteurianum BC1]
MYRNCCSLNTLTILILIILQFGNKGKKSSTEGCKDKQLVDDGVLFIITLFYLCCYNSRRRNCF